MERLTELHYKKSDGYYMKCSGTCTKDTCECCDNLWLLLQRLGAYEDTGMGPEEILSAADMAKVACALHELNQYREILGDGCDLGRLRELVEADRDGRCVVFPCKVGDKVWIVRTVQDGKSTKEVCEFGKIKRISVDAHGTFLLGDYCHTLNAEKIGKSAFLAREAAQQALRGSAENGT